MPLPVTNVAWPPVELAPLYRQYAEWDAWYTGDPDQLMLTYSVVRPNAQSSVWGQVKRFFWGGPTPGVTPQRPNKLHIPLPSDISRTSAALIFADLPDLAFPDESADPDAGTTASTVRASAKARLAEIIDDRAHATLLEAAEVQSAIGGTFVRVAWDTDVDPDKPFLTTVPADAAWPEFSWGRLRAVTFWQELSPLASRPGTFRLLERHEPGRIQWGLYHSREKAQLGIPVPLDEHPDAATLASVVDADSGIATGSTLLTAVYVPNQMPNRKWRRDPVGQSIGRSDYDGVEALFDALDETYTSWMRDLRLARARIMVDQRLLDSRGPGKGAVFDSDREVFTNYDASNVGSLNVGAKQGGADGLPIAMFQPEIRFEAHAATSQHFLERAIAAAGYSTSTFGESGDLAMTATEIQNREKATVLTRSAKLLHWRPALRDILCALLDVDAHVFNGPGRGQARPDVEFADAAAESPKVVAETLSLLNSAESVSIRTKVEMLHPDWIKEQVDAEVEAIKADYSVLPDPTMKHLWAAQAADGSADGLPDPTTQQEPASGDPATDTAG